MGFAGNGMKLWKTLSKKKQLTVSLQDFEPELCRQLDRLVGCMLRMFPRGTLEMWQALERMHAGRTNFPEFLYFLQERCSLPEGVRIEPRRIFDALDKAGRGTVSFEDMRFLDHWAHQRM